MARKKKEETPDIITQQYRIEVIETGPRHLSREDYERELRRGGWPSGEQLEKTIITIQPGVLSEALVEILRVFDKKNKEIDRLDEIIKDFQKAQKKVMETK